MPGFVDRIRDATGALDDLGRTIDSVAASGERATNIGLRQLSLSRQAGGASGGRFGSVTSLGLPGSNDGRNGMRALFSPLGFG